MSEEEKLKSANKTTLHNWARWALFAIEMLCLFSGAYLMIHGLLSWAFGWLPRVDAMVEILLGIFMAGFGDTLSGLADKTGHSLHLFENKRTGDRQIVLNMPAKDEQSHVSQPKNPDTVINIGEGGDTIDEKEAT